MSEKEEVLQTLLTAARGEITALTEANKLLAEQVAASEVKQSWIIHDPQGVIARLRAAAMSLHDAVNKHVAADDRTSLGVAFEEMDNAMAEAVGLEYSVVSAQAVPVAASVGDEYRFQMLLADVVSKDYVPHRDAVAALVAYIDSRTTKVSARAADAPSEPSVKIPHQDTLDSIGGAIAYGRQNENPPPSSDHWLAEFWHIGRQLDKLGETSAWDNVTPIERTSDLPLEQSELAETIRQLRNIASEDVTPYFCANVPKDLLRRAADALDSQPTEPTKDAK